MSLQIVLIPAALGVYALWKAASINEASESRVSVIQTRMRDDALLAEALISLQAHVTQEADGLVARWEGLAVTFSRGEAGALRAHFIGDVDAARADEIVRSVDTAYGRLVQQAVHARVRQRAESLGMTLESETLTDDDSIVLVLQTQQERS